MSTLRHHFPKTSNTLVDDLLSSDRKTREISLARFCTLYYPAVFGFARSLQLSEQDAQDRVQDFFVEIVRDGLLQKFDPRRGSRLSSWLMACFRNLELSHRSSRRTKKRGGGREMLAFDPEMIELRFQAAHLAHLAPEPTFDLMLARELWRGARAMIQKKYQQKGDPRLVAALLPFTVMERWPPPPMVTQQEMAERHGTTLPRLKAFFNRTLKVQIRRAFEEETRSACPGIDGSEIQHLWNLLCRYGEA